jgi:transposase
LRRRWVEAVDVESDGTIVVSLRPGYRQRDRCPHCRRRCPGYDLGEGRRRWRALDLGTTRCYLEADAPRVECKVHGVVVAAVPWARHGAGFTRSFDDQIAWLTVNTSKTAICVLMRIAWRTVGRICERVSAEAKAGRDLFAGLKALGFDEISIRKGQKYLTVVVDHHTGRLVWAAYGRDRKTVEKFLDLLGEERSKQIEFVSCDDAEWITRPVSERCPNAVIALDPFHIVKAATDALDEIRREIWNEARRAGNKQLAKDLKGARFALWKNPGNLSERQQQKLSSIQQINQRLYRAYLLAQQLPPDLPRRRRGRTRAAQSVAEVGPTITPRAIPKARAPDHRTARTRRGGVHQWTLKRPRRADQHTDPPDHPPPVRLPLTKRRHRPRDALTRRALPTPPRTVTLPTDPSVGSLFGPSRLHRFWGWGYPHRRIPRRARSLGGWVRCAFHDVRTRISSATSRVLPCAA